MAKAALSVPVLFALLTLLPTNLGGPAKVGGAQMQKTWCVAKPSTDDKTLLDNVNYACGYVDCRAFQPGGNCYYPNSLVSHASFAMNAYYKAMGKNSWNCDFRNSSLLVVTDPSFAGCIYA